MNFRFALIVFIFMSLVFETSLISLPLVYVLSLVLFILFPDAASIIVGFIAGLFLDILRVDTIGLVPIIILASFIVIDIIRRVFELKDYRIILLIVFAASYIYASVFTYTSNILWYGAIYLAIGLIIFYFGRKSLWQG